MGLLVWLIPQLLLYGLSAAGFLFPGASNGRLEPRKAVMCTSDSMNFTCTLDIDRPASDLLYRLYWTREPVTADPNALHIVGDKSLVLTLDNVTMAEDNLNVVCCVDGCTGNDHIGESVILRVFETPVIKNFSCVNHGWIDGTLVCDWSLGLAEPKASWIIVKLKWRIPQYSGTWFDCPDMSPESCVWNNTNNTQHDRLIEIVLTVNQTECGKYLEFSSTFNSLHRVKPAPVGALSSEVVNSTCISVSWFGAKATWLKKYHVYLTSRWHDYQNWTIEEKKPSTMQPMGHIFCGLHPHTSYTFSVKVHPVTGGYWSEEMKITDTTTQDVPARSPQMAAGSYRWDPRDCDSPGAERLISVYWEALEETYWNGVLQRIILTFDPPLIEGRVELAADVLQKRQRLRCDTAYTVTVQAGTAVGLSSPGSVLTVPAYTDAVAQPKFMLEMGDTLLDDHRRDLNVSWEPSTNPEVTGYTVFYCRKEQGNCAKNSSIVSESYNASQSMMVLKLRGPEDYIYGVSAGTAHGASGFSWLSCIYTMNVDPTKSPENLQVTEGSDNNALDVKWNPLACESGQPFIQAYRLTYCVTDHRRACRDKEFETLVPSDRTSTVLRDLQADVRYAVRVQGVTARGAQGPLSEPVYATPVDHRLTVGAIVGIAFGSLFVLALALSGLVYTLRCMNRRAKETLKKSEIKDLPISTQGRFTSQEDDTAASDGYTNQAYIGRSPTTNGHIPRAAVPGRQLSADSGLPEDPSTPKPEEVGPPSPKVRPLPDDYYQVNFDNESQDSSESIADSSEVSTGSFTGETLDFTQLRNRVYPAGITWIAPQQDSVVFHVTAQPHLDIIQGSRTCLSHRQKEKGNVANPTSPSPVHPVSDEVGSGESVSSYIQASLLPGFQAPALPSGVLLRPAALAEPTSYDDHTTHSVTATTDSKMSDMGVMQNGLSTIGIHSDPGNQGVQDTRKRHNNCHVIQAPEVDADMQSDQVQMSDTELTPLLVRSSSIQPEHIASELVPADDPRGVMTPDLNQAVTNNNHFIQSLNKKGDTHYSDYCEASCVHYQPSLSDNSGPNTSDLVPEDIDYTDEPDNDLTSERTAAVDQHSSTCNHAGDGYVTTTKMTSVVQHPNLSSDNTSDDGEKMVSIGKLSSQASNSNVNNHSNNECLNTTQISSIGKCGNKTPSRSIINHGNNEDITRAHVAPISQSPILAANSATSNHGHNDCIAREQLPSVHQICRQSQSKNTGTNGNEANIQTTKISLPTNQISNIITSNHGNVTSGGKCEQMVSTNQPTNQVSNINTSNHGTDGYVTSAQMASISQPTKQVSNINASNLGNDGYVTSAQMASISQPTNHTSNTNTSNHGNGEYVTSEQMAAKGRPANHTSKNNTSNHGNDGYVTSEKMAAKGQPTNHTSNTNTSNHGNDGYVTRGQMASISQPTNLTSKTNSSNHGNDGYVTSEQMASISHPTNQATNSNTSNHGNDGYVTSEQMASISRPTNQATNSNTSNHGNDGYVTSEQMASISRPTNQATNINTSNHGNDGYVTSEQMAAISQPTNHTSQTNTSDHGNDGYVTSEQMAAKSRPTNHTSQTNSSNHGNDGYVTSEQMAAISHPTNQATNINTSNHDNDGYVTSEQMAAISQPTNQVSNINTSNHGNDGYVTSEKV